MARRAAGSRGSFASARAIAVRCCMPPDSMLRVVILEAFKPDLVDVMRGDLALLAPAARPSRAGRSRCSRAPSATGTACSSGTPCRDRRRAPRRRWPSSSTCPAVGASRPATMRSSVLLPHPDGPRIVMKSLSATAVGRQQRLRRRPAATPGNVRETPRSIDERRSSAAIRRAHEAPRKQRAVRLLESEIAR